MTPEITSIILEKIEAGNFLEIAARCAGVSYQTFKAWMRRGRSEAPEDAEFSAFATAVRRARAKAEADSVDKIKKAETWSAHAWYLERSFQKRWMRREKADLPVPDFSKMTDDQIVAFIKGAGGGRA